MGPGERRAEDLNHVNLISYQITRWIRSDSVLKFNSLVHVGSCGSTCTGTIFYKITYSVHHATCTATKFR
eukprot:SAG11_NODE_18856_length_479_cov_5.818421_1_plen_69_part_01